MINSGLLLISMDWNKEIEPNNYKWTIYKEHNNFINPKRMIIINLDNPDCHKTTLKLESRLRRKDKFYLSIFRYFFIYFLFMFSIILWTMKNLEKLRIKSQSIIQKETQIKMDRNIIKIQLCNQRGIRRVDDKSSFDLWRYYIFRSF